MVRSTEPSTRIRDDRRFMKEGCGAASENLLCAVVVGRVERDWEVERELRMDMVVWTRI